MAEATSFVCLELRDGDDRVIDYVTIDRNDTALVPRGWVRARARPKSVKGIQLYDAYVAGQELSHMIIGRPPVGQIVDHIDGNPLNNRRINLRFATSGVNAHNRQKQSGMTSQYIGVSKRKRTGKWIATCRFDHKIYYFGLFDNELDAAKARDMGAIRLYGSFAKTNNILTKEEIQAAHQMEMPTPSGLGNKKRVDSGDVTLPVGVHFTRGRYIARVFNVAGIAQEKSFTTLEEAKTARLASVQLKKIADDMVMNLAKEAARRDTPVLIDEHGQAIIITNAELDEKDAKHHVVVDKESWHDFNDYTWRWSPSQPVPLGNVDNKLVKMHRWAWMQQQKTSSLPAGTSVDHINTQIGDLRTINLRAATRSQQSQNRRKRKGTTSDYVGVYGNGQKWRAGIGYRGKHYWLGSFATEVEAATAYNKQADIWIPGGARNDVATGTVKRISEVHNDLATCKRQRVANPNHENDSLCADLVDDEFEFALCVTDDEGDTL